MRTRDLLSSCLVLSAAAMLAWSGATGSEPDQLRADSYEPFRDSDGDLLPDALEWVALTNPALVDSNDNGVDDFQEVVEHRLLLSSPGPRPIDNATRALVYSTTSPEGKRELYLALLLELVNTGVGSVQSLQPFIATNGVMVPITQLLGTCHSNLTTRVGRAGLYVAFVLRLSSASELRALMPCTVGFVAVIDGRRHVTGSYLMEADAVEAALVPISSAVFALQPANLQDSFSNPFWKRNRLCVMDLDVIGTSGNGSLCEVRNADCTVANGLVCANSCSSAKGCVIFVPEGLSTLTGGG